MISVPQAYRFYFILNLLFYSLILFLGCSTDSSSEEDLLSFTISLSVEGQGTVAPKSDSYDRNALILFEATPAPGYYFDRWIGFGETVESAQYEWVVTHDLMLTALFLPLPEITIIDIIRKTSILISSSNVNIITKSMTRSKKLSYTVIRFPFV